MYKDELGMGFYALSLFTLSTSIFIWIISHLVTFSSVFFELACKGKLFGFYLAIYDVFLFLAKFIIINIQIPIFYLGLSSLIIVTLPTYKMGKVLESYNFIAKGYSKKVILIAFGSFLVYNVVFLFQ
jgi:hypothetical protein